MGSHERRPSLRFSCHDSEFCCVGEHHQTCFPCLSSGFRINLILYPRPVPLDVPSLCTDSCSRMWGGRGVRDAASSTPYLRSRRVLHVALGWTQPVGVQSCSSVREK